jgi:hypothetical protein
MAKYYPSSGEILMDDSKRPVVVPPGCTMTEVDLSVDADQTVTASPAYLLGVYVNVVMSAQAANIKNGAAIKLTLPASLAAGTKIDCHSAIFSESIIIASNDAATGKIVLFWRAS